MKKRFVEIDGKRMNLEIFLATKNLKVEGYLDLSGCTGLTALPEGLTVGGYLDLSGCTGLTALPEGLTVGGSLYLSGCTGLTRVKFHPGVKKSIKR